MEPVRLEPLGGDRASDAAELVREYMLATEIERGNTAVIERGLLDVLERECAALLARFAPPNRLLLAYVGDDLAGGVGVKLTTDGAEISRLYVREAYRTCGIATQLMAAAEEYAREQGGTTTDPRCSSHENAGDQLVPEHRLSRRRPVRGFADADGLSRETAVEPTPLGGSRSAIASATITESP
jgi:GNAT superfamily N-acetyltransferase